MKVLNTNGRVLALCFGVIAVDGFDTAAIGVVVPALAATWGLPPAAFASSFVATSGGAVLGYLACGALCARWGARRALLAAVALFGLGSLATALAGTVGTLALLRLMTGVGLGAALPSAIGLAVAALPPARREAGAVLVAGGLSVGTLLGGLLGGGLIAAGGWTMPFVGGGLLPLALLPVLAWGLPRDADMMESAGIGGTGVAALLDTGQAAATLLLWLFAFAGFAAVYMLVYWLPTLLLAFGYATSDAPAGAAWFGLGGVLGALALAALAGRLGAVRCLAAAAALGTLALALLLVLPLPLLSRAGVAGLVVAAGACLVACTVGQSGVAVALYPAAMRIAGIGCAAAAGRLGSIVGPAAAGALLVLATEPRWVLLGVLLPVALAALLAGVLARRVGQAR
jgi:MFS transporter, AAHS family, 4-hydroxybenzoate transporter